MIRTAIRSVSRGAPLLRGAAVAPRSFPALRFAQTTHPAIVRSFSTEVPPEVDAEADEAPVAAASPAAKKFEFQAETRKLLEIVTHSIYTDKEVFLRELISNASDSLEKYRYMKSTGNITGDDQPLEINISVNPKKRTLTISDNGIGMTSDELVANLGTIARSGSKQFVEQLRAGESSSREGDGIIGQFGVGFYSAFMVSKSVSVESLSANAQEGEAGATWTSAGSGDFTVDPTVGVARGSRIEMQLKENCKEYADVKKVKEIIKKYSNFVPFPIKVEGEVVNTISAIWVQDKNSVTEEQYTEFYKYISNAFDKPSFQLHFSTDAPINLNALLFVPSFHTEKFGQGRMEAGVSLYSRKVLIESKPADLLPDWLRFIKGVVDSEDLPLSISREKPQDSMLLKKIKDVLTRKMLRVFADLMKNDAVKYKEFYIEFGNFLKEGICQDYGYQKQLSKLLLFESSALDNGTLTSLDEYSSRCKPDQKKIYYLVAPNRSTALNSPYYETFKKSGVEVLFLYTTIDDFVMSNLRTFGDKALISAEMSALDLPDEESKADDKDSEAKEGDVSNAFLTEEQSKEICAWLKVALGSRVSDVKITNRLSDSPAIVTDHESGTMRRMLRMVEQSNSGKASELPPAVLEVNAKHPIIKKLYTISCVDGNADRKALGELVAAQLLDNALIAAGLVDDPRSMLPRLNSILSATLDDKN